MNDDERQQRIKECTLYEMAYINTCTAMNNIEVQLVKWRLTLRHKATWDSASACHSLEAWLPNHSTETYRPGSTMEDLEAHDPDLSIRELVDIHTLVAGEIKRLKRQVADDRHPIELRETRQKDIEDETLLSDAAESVCQEFERMQMMQMMLRRKDSAMNTPNTESA
jgi:hypothetical protein